MYSTAFSLVGCKICRNREARYSWGNRPALIGQPSSGGGTTEDVSKIKSFAFGLPMQYVNEWLTASLLQILLPMICGHVTKVFVDHDVSWDLWILIQLSMDAWFHSGINPFWNSDSCNKRRLLMFPWRCVRFCRTLWKDQASVFYLIWAF